MSNDSLNTEVGNSGKAGGTTDRLTRRDFLQLLSIGGAGALWGLGKLTENVWQPGVVHLGIDCLRNPETIEDILQASASLLEGLALKDRRVENAPSIVENSLYKPISEIISETLDARRKMGKPIEFQRVDGYKDSGYYLDKIRESIDDPKNRDRKFIKTGEINESSYVLGCLPGTFTNFDDPEHPIFPPAVAVIWEASNRTFNFSQNLLVPGSGIAGYVIKSLGPGSKGLFDPSSNYWTYHIDEVDKVTKSYLIDVKMYIETLVNKKGAVSAGMIFDRFLDKNGGDIGSSLLDTMIFLKFMARQDTTFKTFDEVKLDPELSKANEEWFKRNILDEYGKLGIIMNCHMRHFLIMGSFLGLRNWQTEKLTKTYIF